MTTPTAPVPTPPNQRDDDFDEVAFDAQMTAEDPRYPARKAASEAMNNYVNEWIAGYELDDGEVSHSPTEMERFLITDAFAGLSSDEEYIRLEAAWRALCGKPAALALPAAPDEPNLPPLPVPTPPNRYTYTREQVYQAIRADRRALGRVSAPPLPPADVQGCQCPACSRGVTHHSDCAVHNLPASPNGPCDCGALERHGWLTKARVLVRALGDAISANERSIGRGGPELDVACATAEDALDDFLRGFSPAAPSVAGGVTALLDQPARLLELLAEFRNAVAIEDDTGADDAERDLIALYAPPLPAPQQPPADLLQAVADVEACVQEMGSQMRVIDADKHWRNNLSVKLEALRFYTRGLRSIIDGDTHANR